MDTPHMDASLGTPPTAYVGARARDRDMEPLLRELFAGGDAARLFVVLRNGERLPQALAGNDLDVAVLPGASLEDVLRLATARALPLGWTPVCVSRRVDTIGFSLVERGGSDAPRALHVDVFNGVCTYGVCLLPRELLVAESTLRDGVRELTARGRVLATLAHHVAASGALTKDKYLEELIALLRSPADRAWLIAQVEARFGRALARELDASDGLRALRRPSRRRQLGVLASAMRGMGRFPWTGTRAVLRYATGQLPSMLHPAGVVGCTGDRFGDPPELTLSPALACGIAPLAMIAPRVRAHPLAVWTFNNAKHRRHIRRVWQRATLLRWVAPSAFLWLQAKRSRIVVLDRLPLALRVLRRMRAPSWLARAPRRELP